MLAYQTQLCPNKPENEGAGIPTAYSYTAVDCYSG